MKTILFYFILLISFASNAQQLDVKKSFLGYRAALDGEKILMTDFKKHISTDYKSYQIFQKGRNKRGFATVMSFAGGVCLGISAAQIYTGGGATGTDKVSLVLPVVGAGLIGGGIVVASSGNRDIKKSVYSYNTTPKVEYKLISNQNGVGLGLSL